MEDQNWESPSLPYNFGHHKQAGTGPSHHTTSKHPTIRRDFAYQPVANPPELPHFHSRLIFLCFKRAECGFSYWHVYSEEWSSNLPPLNVFFRVSWRALFLAEGSGSRFLCLGSGMMCFKWPLGTRFFFSHLGKDLKLWDHWSISNIPWSNSKKLRPSNVQFDKQYYLHHYTNVHTLISLLS